MQSAQAISAAYDFNLAARDYILADGAIDSVVEAIPWSALIDPSQSRELIFYGHSDRLRGRKHALNGGTFRGDLQEHNRCAMNARVAHCLTFTRNLPVFYFSANDKDTATALPTTHRSFKHRRRFRNRRVLCDRFPNQCADREVSQSTAI